MQSAAIKLCKWKSVLLGADRAYTLIEVQVAMAIFSIGILAVGTLILSTTQHNTNGNILTQATMLAQAKIEELKREPDATDCDPNNPIDDQRNPGGIYNLCWTVSGSPSIIEVTVEWDRRGGPPRSVELRTLN